MGLESECEVGDSESEFESPLSLIEDSSTGCFTTDPVGIEGPLDYLDHFDVWTDQTLQNESTIYIKRGDRKNTFACPQPTPTQDPLKRVSRGNSRPPKKAYFRIQLIRGFKKSIRQVATRRWPKAGIYRLDKNNPQHRSLWSNYYSHYRELKAAMEEDTRAEIYNTEEMSFSNSYCRRFFTPQAIRKMYYRYTELVFWDGLHPEEACRKFKFWCCEGETHAGDCEGVWTGIKQCAQFGLFKDLNLRPWNGLQWVGHDEVDTSSLLTVS